MIWLESIDSTNEEIKRRIHEFKRPTWIIAKKQNKGKGRNGNSWLSGDGNFFGSIIFFPTVEPGYLHLYGFFFGVALFNSVRKFVNKGVDIRLKWPNDLMIENGKVSGILLESVKVPSSKNTGLIVGVGVNLNSSPSLNTNFKKRYDAQCLAKFTNKKIDPYSFLSVLNDELIGLGSYVEEKNLCEILKFWEPLSYDKGTKVHIFDEKGKPKTGKFLGLDEMGGLIVDEKSGLKKIYSGNVYFGS